MILLEPDQSSVITARPRCNRLTVAHFLLWMATTGAVLVWRQEQRPPPAEQIGFASFLHQARSEEERQILFKQRQQQVWRWWNARYLVGLAFAPIGGIALAAPVLAAWRVVTGRFCFPVQPGHWLLIALASMMVLAVPRSYLRSQLSADGPDFLITLIATPMFTAVAYVNRERLRWQAAFGLLAAAFAIICLAFAVEFLRPSFEPNGFFRVGLLTVGLFPVTVIFCTTVDLTGRHQFDFFHWMGIATLIGFVAHFIALSAVARFVR